MASDATTCNRCKSSSSRAPAAALASPIDPTIRLRVKTGTMMLDVMPRARHHSDQGPVACSRPITIGRCGGSGNSLMSTG